MSKLTESKFRLKLRETLAREAWRFLMFLEHGQSASVSQNGEWRFLQGWLRLQAEQGRERLVVLDCGANNGGYSKALLEIAAQTQAPPLELFLFEPQPDLQATIRQNLPQLPEGAIIEAGVSSSDGTAILNRPASGSTHASLYQRDERFTDHVEIPLVRLDSFLQKRGIAQVDLLKLDVEGHELEALKGLGEFCHPDKTKVIQFEYGATTLDANSNLKSLFDHLNGRGYQVTKIVPKGLSPRSYKPWLETYQYSNFVACGPNLLK